jgi:hypothetical protein
MSPIGGREGRTFERQLLSFSLESALPEDGADGGVVQVTCSSSFFNATSKVLIDIDVPNWGSREQNI